VCPHHTDLSNLSCLIQTQTWQTGPSDARSFERDYAEVSEISVENYAALILSDSLCVPMIKAKD